VGDPLTRDVEKPVTSCLRRRRKIGRPPLQFSSRHPFPLPFRSYADGSSRPHTRGSSVRLAHVGPPSPRRLQASFRPCSLRPVRPTALDAATRGTTEAAAAPVFLWTPFPHPRRGYADAAPCLRRAVPNDSTSPLASAHHPRFTPRR
jgi:hypothetical protein